MINLYRKYIDLISLRLESIYIYKKGVFLFLNNKL